MTGGLPSELARWADKIRGYAEEFGLDFPEVRFHLLDWKGINEVASYGGFPTRYPHWSYGMEYERMSKSYAYGLHRIYEMVINTDPCHAYLLASNNLIDQKLVMAHVYGHADFFKNNLWYAHTNRRMLDEMANHATRIYRYIERYGYEAVENLIDVGLSIDNLIDIHSPGIRRQPRPPDPALEAEPKTVKRIPSKEYMDSFVNPPDFLAAQKKRLEDETKQARRFPVASERDVMLFLVNHAPLETWEADVLDMLREEAYYFAPQGQTKIMNEGWASFWHSTIMTRRVLSDAEIIDYADHHSGTVAMHSGQLNPYKLGLELLRDVEERWDKGRFGREYDECDDRTRKATWDLKLGLGREKIFEVRRIYNDIGFVDQFLTEDFCERYKLFTYRWNPRTERYEIASRDFAAIKRQLLQSLTNFGQPIIAVEDGNYSNRGELYLRHQHEGVDLKLDYARDTLANLYAVWRRPVHLETALEGKGRTLLTFDGQAHIQKRLD
ncbi:MAG: SpoVR family protein [Anaerolineae bacterium]|nr:SpoVR family protein [Anaerolineae bacterium]